MTRRLILLLATAVAALATSPNAVAATAGTLRAVVGPEFEISLTDASGNRVTQLDPGTYTIVVDDRSDFHNFHLSGPGVNERTGVEFVGTQTWTVTLADGRYSYVCDPHATQMRGAFVVGNPPPPTTPKARRLQALAGPGFTISVRSMAGARVASTARGRVDLVVRDRSRSHNFHLVGPGVNRRTSLAFVGTQTWKLTLRPGLYRFLCDPHARGGMRGSFRVR